MNILQYINSKDIRGHLEKIGYSFSPQEAAWLVYQSRRHTLAEKHAAWRQIAEEFPDAPLTFDHRKHKSVITINDLPEKLADFLGQYLAVEDELLARFQRNDGDFVYCAEVLFPYQVSYETAFSNAYSNFDECIRAVKSWHETALREYDDVPENAKYRVSCRALGNAPVNRASVTLRGDGEILELEDFAGWDESEAREGLNPVLSFEGMWFAFPVPFEKGDILYDPEYEDKSFCGPVVMENITPQHFAETGRTGCDNSDMNVWGYFQNDDGTVYQESTWNYMDYEYYPPEKLTGKGRILTALSNFLKGKIDVELFAGAYLHLLAQEAAKSTRLSSYELRLAGLEPEEKDGNP